MRLSLAKGSLTAREAWRQALVALVCMLAAVVGRMGVYELVGARLPYLTFFPAIIAAVLFGGLLSGTLTVVLSAALATLWTEPIGVFRMSTAEDFLGLLLFSFTALLIVGMGALVSRFRSAAEASRHQARSSAAQAAAAGKLAQEALSSITDAFVSIDRDWIYTYVNPEAERIFGRTASQLAGKSLRNLLPHLPTGAVEPLTRAMDLHVGVEYESYYPALEKWFSTKVYPREHGGAAIYFRDITERKQAEELTKRTEDQIRQLADAIPQLAWMADADGGVVWYNQRWYEYTGTTADAMRGWGWQSVHDPAALPKVLARWNQSIATGEPFEMEFPLRSAAGEYGWFLTRVEPITNEQGRVIRWFGTNTDITDVKRNREEREQLLASERAARSEAERLNRLKDEFLATVSHELRTPLNAILGWSQILKRDLDNREHLAEGLDTIERNSRAQAQLIGDLLDMSRIISGKVRLEAQRVDLAAVIESAIASVRPAAESRQIQLTHVLDPLAGPVTGDPGRLQQVVWNLLSNAIKFTPRGGRVQVLLERVNSHVELTVSDNGEGIPTEFLPYVFDRFRQADATTTRRHGGLGIGLAIVKNLIEMHGGTIQAHSAGTGQGATFTVALPLRPAAPAEVERLPERTSTRAGGESYSEPTLEGVRVLVIDDEPDARLVVKRLLAERGAEIELAASTREGLAAVHQQRPHVILSDIGMPERDGYDFIRSLRQSGVNTPAVALTALARAEDRLKAIHAGYQMHLPKPVEPAELIAVVASLAGRIGTRASAVANDDTVQ